MYLHSCITYIHVPSDKTPPMSPRRVARDVIETLDTDGNGELDSSEFYAWLAAGIDLSTKQRQNFADKGPLNKHK